MSTDTVPGRKPKKQSEPDHGDELHAGCWAEHEDEKSFIFVKNYRYEHY